MTDTATRKSRSQDVQNCIDEAISKISQIDYWTKDNTDSLTAKNPAHQLARPKRSAHTASVKAKQYKRLATTIRNQLFSSKSKNDSNLASLNYFYNSLITIKNEIRLTVARNNPALPAQVTEWCKQYPQYSKIIKPLVDDKSKYVNKVRVAAYNKLVALDKVDADILASELKTLAKSGGLEHPAIQFLNLTEAENTRRKSAISKNLKDRKSDIQSYNLGFINRVTTECLNSSDFNELALGIALATGRRAIEVIYTGIFKAVSSNKLSFAGQAKKGRGVKTKPYIIPTLLDTALIVAAVEKLRSTERFQQVKALADAERAENRNKTINTACARMLNYTAKRVLDPKNKPAESRVKFKDSRVIAVQTAILKIMPQPEFKKMDINVFLEQFNGHDGFKEFENYQHVAILDAPEEVQEAKEDTADTLPANTDISALEAADTAINELGKKTLYKLHERVKELASKTGLELNQSFLYKGRKINGQLQKAGGSLDLIKTYMTIPAIAKAIKAYNSDK